MPLPKDEFEEKALPPGVDHLGKNQSRVIDYLRANPDEAFHRSEIQKALGIKHDGATLTALNSLKSKGLVIAREVDGRVYWGLADEQNRPTDTGGDSGQEGEGSEPTTEEDPTPEDVSGSSARNKKGGKRKSRNNANKSRKRGRKGSKRKK